MIVVDSNVIAYCWIPGANTAAAQRLRATDPDWHAPLLWQSEIRSVLLGYLRHGQIAMEHAASVMEETSRAMEGCEHLVDGRDVLELAAATRLSAYDCEFVALAHSLAVPLVTGDREILKAFPDIAVTIEDFLAAADGARGTFQRRAQYRLKGTPRPRAAARHS